MEAETALNIQLIRLAIMEQVSNLEDLKTLSLLNSDWNYDCKKFIERKSKIYLRPTSILSYGHKCDVNFSHGKNIEIDFLFPMDLDDWGRYMKWGQKSLLRKVASLAPRINCLNLMIGRPFTAIDIHKILKFSQGATSLSFNIKDTPSLDHSKLQILNRLLTIEPLLFPQTKSLKIIVKENEWNGTNANFFQKLLSTAPNITKLEIWSEEPNYSFQLIKFFKTFGGLENITDLSLDKICEQLWEIILLEEISLKKIKFSICEDEINALELLLEKYRNRLTKVNLIIHGDFEEMNFPPMENLQKLNIFMTSKTSIGNNTIILSKNEFGGLGYPKISKLKLTSYNRKGVMKNLQNISKKQLLLTSNYLKDVKAMILLKDEEFTKWYQSKKEAKYLKELKALFPNAIVEMRYEQLLDPEWLNEQLLVKRKDKCAIL